HCELFRDPLVLVILYRQSEFSFAQHWLSPLKRLPAPLFGLSKLFERFECFIPPARHDNRARQSSADRLGGTNICFETLHIVRRFWRRNTRFDIHPIGFSAMPEFGRLRRVLSANVYLNSRCSRSMGLLEK